MSEAVEEYAKEYVREYVREKQAVNVKTLWKILDLPWNKH